jgi:transposase InsO family protein
MCRLYGVTRSGFYAWEARGLSTRQIEDERLCSLIEHIYQDSRSTYGSPRIYKALKDGGMRIGRKRVERLMRYRGIKARCVRVYPRSRKGLRKYYDGIPNRSLGITPTRPDQVWVGDITYLKTAGGQWRYLATVMDKYSRKIIGSILGRHKDARLTLAAFNQAVEARKPQPGTIFHTDRGTEYGTFTFRQRLAELGFVQSMNRPNGKMTDNAFMESFFHTLKTECTCGVHFADEQAMADCIYSYLPFYNSKRMHSSLGYLSPEEYEVKATV